MQHLMLQVVFVPFFLGGGKKGGPGRHPFAGVLGGLRTKVWPDVRQYLWPLSDSGGQTTDHEMSHQKVVKYPRYPP